MKTPTCDVCNEPIEPIEDGRVSCSAYGSSLGKNGESQGFIDAVTRCYFVQFRDFYEQLGRAAGAEDAGSWYVRMNNPALRLEIVLKDVPVDPLWLVTHDRCLPPDLVAAYDFPLREIATAEEAIKTTLHVSHKKFLHWPSWIYVLGKVFDP